MERGPKGGEGGYQSMHDEMISPSAYDAHPVH